MRYNDSFPQSAEYLRLALPLMSRQDAALHPHSYAIWYEYVAGINPALKEAVDGIVNSGKKLDEQATGDLYRQHVAELDVETARHIGSRFQRVLAEMSQSAAQTGSQASQFGTNLERWVRECADIPPDHPVFKRITTLLTESRQMRDSVISLVVQLENSRQEIVELRNQVSKARADALADALTGLANRKGFDLALADCLAQADASGCGPSLLVVDIDHFKAVNDSYGHLFGDKVLRSVAQVLKQNLKGKDTAARYGGEEFAILLPDTSADGARCLADTIRSSIERARVKRTESQEIVAQITVSLGVACYRPGETALEFFERADEALYVSKQTGRNRVTVAKLH